MLANDEIESAPSGTFGKTIQLPAASRLALCDFIAEQLPRWRDRIDRSPESSETGLTSQLCAHLNSIARRSDGWDIFQFRTETPDESHKGRKIDLVPSPSACTIWIDGRKYVDFDSVMPIECKRLPTPQESNRDEWEYVIHRNGSTGGIQRFKEGQHGSIHGLGAMIAYIQKESGALWFERINGWIRELMKQKRTGWSDRDVLELHAVNAANRVTVVKSSHSRSNDLQPIELRHLWLEMN